MVEGARVEANVLGKELKIFFQDEARFGRIDTLRRCWAPSGIRPLLKKQIDMATVFRTKFYTAS